MFQSRLEQLTNGVGSTKDMIYVAWCLLHGVEAEQDIKAGERWLTLAARNGDSEAQIRLAEYFESGEFVEINCEESTYWYEEVAKAKDFFGSYGVAIRYYFGSACCAKNEAKAHKFFTLASSQGHLVSAAQLAKLRRTGRYGFQERLYGYVMPVCIALKACWLILNKRADDSLWDAGRWLPKSALIQKLRNGTIFE